MARGRVRSLITGQVANLVDWLPGQYCKVFTGYDAHLAGYVKMPCFATWQKQDTVKESNSVPVGVYYPEREMESTRCWGIQPKGFQARADLRLRNQEGVDWIATGNFDGSTCGTDAEGNL